MSPLSSPFFLFLRVFFVSVCVVVLAGFVLRGNGERERRREMWGREGGRDGDELRG